MSQSFDAVVIGAGPGGYVCAIRLAQLGVKTAVIERDELGGVCLNVGCIPSKALIHAADSYHKTKTEFATMGITAKATIDAGQLQAWKESVVKKLTSGVGQILKANGVTVLKGEATFNDKNTIALKSGSSAENISFKNAVIATGSRNIDLPFLKVNKTNILSSTEALALKEIPKSFLVIGGGFIGLEIGVVYAKLGAKVTLIEAMDQILPTIDADLVRVVSKASEKFGMTILTQTKAKKLHEDSPEGKKTLHLDVEAADGKVTTLEAEKILVAVGRRPNSEGLGLEKLGVKVDERGNVSTNAQGQTNVNGVFAIGDVTGAPQLAHRASMDGLIVAAAIAGEKSFKDYRVVPWAVFSDPEIASCGLSEKEAKSKNINYRLGTFPFAASGKAIATNSTEGFIKVLLSAEDDSVLGVHMVGPEVSNIIAEPALAMEMGAVADDITRTIHTHPTLPEAFMEAVEAAHGRAIHIHKPLRRGK